MTKTALRIEVPQPCTQNWSAMTPTEQGRFCMSCNKQVFDFTHISDQKILEILAIHGGNSCGHFLPSQLNRPLQQRPQAPQLNILQKMIASSLFFINTLVIQAQTTSTKWISPQSQSKVKQEPLTTKRVVANAAPDSLYCQGKVVDDSTGLALPGAIIRIKNLLIGNSSNIDGNFKFFIPENIIADSVTVVVQYLGYNSLEKVINRRDMPFNGEFRLQESTRIEIVSKPEEGSSVRTMTTGYAVSIVEPVKTKWWQFRKKNK
jgi:hypothetical protein